MPWRRLGWVRPWLMAVWPDIFSCRGLQIVWQDRKQVQNKEKHIFKAGLHCTVHQFPCPTARMWTRTSSGADPMTERSTGLARGPNHVCHAARSMHACRHACLVSSCYHGWTLQVAGHETRKSRHSLCGWWWWWCYRYFNRPAPAQIQ